MKILFSPSEAKSDLTEEIALNINSFFIPELFDKRLHVIDKFNSLLKNASLEDLQKLFGIKDEKVCLRLKQSNILTSPTCKSILRYTGVAYEYLDFNSMNVNQKNWISENLIIFSNLFGPILASDEIPIYKFKQGSSIDMFKPEKFYKENFSAMLDRYLNDGLIIDLRAGFYEKFYTIKKPYISMKFIKNNKVVSHWAKAYRGKVLRQLAQFQPKTEKDFEDISFYGLSLKEIIETKFKREYVFSIV